MFLHLFQSFLVHIYTYIFIFISMSVSIASPNLTHFVFTFSSLMFHFVPFHPLLNLLRHAILVFISVLHTVYISHNGSHARGVAFLSRPSSVSFHLASSLSPSLTHSPSFHSPPHTHPRSLLFLLSLSLPSLLSLSLPLSPHQSFSFFFSHPTLCLLA